MQPLEFVRSAARELGFTTLGVARAESLEPEGRRYREWLQRGYAGGMGWLGRRVAERQDPATGMGARSVIVVALPHGSGQPEPEAGEGRVARYARGRDYHNLMGKRLRKLAARLRQRYPTSLARSYVDTGPVLEKAWGARAGLGWQGKNTLLISPAMGSYFFLGVVLTSLDLEPADPAVDLCGSCTLCLEACPTGALVEPCVLDSRLCLSYLTIEERGPLPEPLRPAVGDRVFGCDACQEVCPYNRRPATQVEPDFMQGTPHESLDALLTLDDQSFDGLTRGRALRRPGREGLARNAAVVAGVSGDSARVPALAHLLQEDPSPLVRGHAAWALGRLGGTPVREALERAARDEQDPTVRDEIARALE